MNESKIRQTWFLQTLTKFPFFKVKYQIKLKVFSIVFFTPVKNKNISEVYKKHEDDLQEVAFKSAKRFCT